jgi:FMN phosphatase YigB (HAD superfamily)
MKYIFDFDDVLFKNIKHFREHIYMTIENAGISRKVMEEYYSQTGGAQFDLKKMLSHFSLDKNLYEKIITQSRNFLNNELFNIVKKIGKENCYIVTHSTNESWQKDKIRNSGIESFFLEIFVVQKSKKDAIEKICEKHKDEKVLFIDDKEKHFENLDFKKYPNLKTILFDEHGLEKLKKELS